MIFHTKTSFTYILIDILSTYTYVLKIVIVIFVNEGTFTI